MAADSRSPYRTVIERGTFNCEHCGALLSATMNTSEGLLYEISYWGQSVHEPKRCVELRVLRDAVKEVYRVIG